MSALYLSMRPAPGRTRLLRVEWSEGASRAQRWYLRPMAAGRFVGRLLALGHPVEVTSLWW